MRIFLIRHAQTHYNQARILQGHKNALLNENGELQAETCGKYLSKIPIDGIFGSDLARCQDTASIILEQQEHPQDVIVEFSPNFRERGMGPLEGMPVQEAKMYVQSLNKGFEHFGEDSKLATLRMLKGFRHAVDKMEQEHMQNVLIVSHGSVIPKLLRHLLATGGAKLGPGISEHHVTVPHNTAITVLERSDSNEPWVITSVNDTNHLSSVEQVNPLVL